MATIQLNNVVLVYVRSINKPNDFGKYSYTFMCEQEAFCTAVAKAMNEQFDYYERKGITVKTKRTQITPDFILSKAHVKDYGAFDHDNNDIEKAAAQFSKPIMVTVNNKEPMKCTTKKQLACGSIADIKMDVYLFEKSGCGVHICRCAPRTEKACIHVTKVVEYKAACKDEGWDCEEDENSEAIPF